MIQYLGLWLLIALSFNTWALISVLRSASGWTSKFVWTVVLLCLPGLGFLGWYLIGPRQAV